MLEFGLLDILFWLVLAIAALVFICFACKAGTVGVLFGIKDFMKHQQKERRKE